MFSEHPFYGNYSTLDSHTNTVISHAFAYLSRWHRKSWQGLLYNIVCIDFLEVKFFIFLEMLEICHVTIKLCLWYIWWLIILNSFFCLLIEGLFFCWFIRKQSKLGWYPEDIEECFVLMRLCVAWRKSYFVTFWEALELLMFFGYSFFNACVTSSSTTCC